MAQTKALEISPKCPKCQSAEFELRVLKDEAVATARCINCAANYLLLDSEEHWFDVIQTGYPRITRCSCKSESFRLRIDYNFREDGDIKYLEVHSICSACGKARRQLDFEVDYSGTDHLVNQPLVPCKNPKILYDLKQYNLLLLFPDMSQIVEHLAVEAKCKFISRVRRNDSWINILQDAAGAKTTIERDKFLFIYATPSLIELAEEQVGTLKKEHAFWKRSEVIRIGSKSHVCTYRSADNVPQICHCSAPPTHAMYTEVGLSFYIEFSSEFVCEDKIVKKSELFKNVTTELTAVLKRRFVSWRGPRCFDNPDVNVRIFGERFRRGAKTGKP